MAKIISTVPPTQPVVESLQLELTGDEACMLLDLMNQIGGSPYDSRRRHCDAIRRALEEPLGIRDTAMDLSGTPMFT